MSHNCDECGSKNHDTSNHRWGDDIDKPDYDDDKSTSAGCLSTILMWPLVLLSDLLGKFFGKGCLLTILGFALFLVLVIVSIKF